MLHINLLTGLIASSA